MWGYALAVIIGMCLGFAVFVIGYHLVWLWSTRLQRRMYERELDGVNHEIARREANAVMRRHVSKINER